MSTPYPSHLGKGIPLYRCDSCRRMVAPWHIEQGGCVCGGRRMHPGDPRWWELPRLYLTRPRDWRRYLQEDRECS